MHIHLDACSNHNDDTIKTSDTVLRKYTSHFIERVVCERELGTEQNGNILTLTPLAITAFVSRSPGLLNRGPWGPLRWVQVFSIASCLQLVWSPNCSVGDLRAPSAGCWLSLLHLVFNWSGLQTNWLPVFTELHNSSMPTFLWTSQIALIQPIHGQGYNILIDRMHLLFTKVHFLFWQPGRVVDQYTSTGNRYCLYFRIYILL